MAASPTDDDVLVDRSKDMTSLRAMLTGLFRYRELMRNLVLKDLKLKYRGSVVGFLWSLLNPLLMLLVYTIAFTYILRVQTEGFVFFLLLGLLPWTFFANATMMSTGAIIDNGSLLKSVTFPRAVLPIATVLFNLAQFLLTIVVFLPLMMAIYGIRPVPPMLLFPVFLALQILFTIGVALAISTGTAFFRDIRHLLEVALSMLFWLTPIVYDLDTLPEAVRVPLLLSPMSSFVLAYRQMFYEGTWPVPEVWLVASAYALGALCVGTALFLRFQRQFAEQL